MIAAMPATLSPRAFRPCACALAGWLALAAFPAPALQPAECHADHEAYLEALASNREQRLAAARDALAETADEAHRARIRAEGEAAWEHEEQMRGLAAQNLRDCLQHVERLRSGAG